MMMRNDEDATLAHTHKLMCDYYETKKKACVRHCCSFTKDEQKVNKEDLFQV